MDLNSYNIVNYVQDKNTKNNIPLNCEFHNSMLSLNQTSQKYIRLFNETIRTFVQTSDCLPSNAICNGNFSSDNDSSEPILSSKEEIVINSTLDVFLFSESTSLRKFTIFLLSVFVLLSFLWFLFGCYVSVFTFYQKRMGVVVQTTVLIATIGTLGLFLESIYILYYILTAYSLYEFGVAMAGIAFIFCTIAALNISLLWIEIAQDVRRGKVSGDAKITRYILSLFVFVIVLGTAMPALLDENAFVFRFGASTMFFVLYFCISFLNMQVVLKV